MKGLGVRWTVGDVSPWGFEALRLSLWGARKAFGPEAAMVVCVNTISVEEARDRAGDVPHGVEWYDASADVPAFLRAVFGPGMAEGVGWKLAPMRYFPDLHELSLDNDLILWSMPPAVSQWLDRADTCVVAEDVVPVFGQFADLCPGEPRNGGLRGLPPRFDLQAAMQEVLDERPGIVLSSELDEQGLQTAAIARRCQPLVVTVDEVSICSPWPPHLPCLGSCGAHFCGLNASRLSWDWEGRNAVELTRAHFDSLKREIAERVGLPVGVA